MNRQTGFTLVEIAIVMVIIGLLLGGVLKGQEIITNAKIKKLENDVSGITAAIYSYQDRYRALPGDDSRADSRFTLTAAKKGNGDGVVAGDFDSITDTDESRLFWLHLRNAGLVAGGADETQQPFNAFNGLTGVSTGAVITNGGIPGLFVGFSQIPQNIAQMVDSRSDDGLEAGGSVQAVLEGAAAAAGGTDYSQKGSLYKLYFAL